MQLVPLPAHGLPYDPAELERIREAQRPLPVEVVARERALARGADAYDAETGDWLPVTPEMAARERQMRDAFALGRLMQAVVVREVFDQKLYLAAGCETREQYAEEVLGCGFRTASNLYRTATRLAPYLPSADTLRLPDGDPNRKPVSGSAEPDAVAEAIQATPISSLYELVKLDEDTLDTLLDGSALTLADGRTVSVEDFRRASRREATQLVRDLKAQYRARIARDQERATLAEAEADVLRERLERAEAEVTLLRDAELRWGPRQAHAEAMMRLMEDMERHIRAIGVAADQIEARDDAPDAVCRAAGSFLHRFETHFLNLRDRLAPLTARL